MRTELLSNFLVGLIISSFLMLFSLLALVGTITHSFDGNEQDRSLLSIADGDDSSLTMESDVILE